MMDFDPDRHACCPICEFEVLYINAVNEEVSFIFSVNGMVDDESTEFADFDVRAEEHEIIYCNHIKCDFNMPYDQFKEQVLNL